VRVPRPAVVGAAACLALALTGCGADRIETAAAAEEGGPCVVEIGTLGPLSGPAADFGLSMKGTADLAAEEVNQAGGLRVGDRTCTVTVHPYDTGYTSAGAANAAGDFVSQGIRFVIGPLGATEVTGMKPLAGRNDMLLVANGFGRDALEPKYPLVFHVAPGPSVWAGPIIAEARKRFDIRNVTVVATNDQSGSDIADVNAIRFREAGLPVTQESYQRGTQDFAPLVSRILSTQPDLVDVASSPAGDAGTMIKQLRQAGYQGAFCRLGGESTAEIARVAGGYEVLGDFFFYSMVDLDDPAMKELSARYELFAGRQATSLTLGWMPGARALLRAISAAGTITDTKAVAEKLRADPLDDPALGHGVWTGMEEFGIQQEMSFPFYAGFVQDGQMQPLVRLEVS
jgi:branched-chain amino acid transport system substrate-binding protein